MLFSADVLNILLFLFFFRLIAHGCTTDNQDAKKDLNYRQSNFFWLKSFLGCDLKRFQVITSVLRNIRSGQSLRVITAASEDLGDL